MEDVLLDTDGGSGLSRASSSFGHVAHPPSSRVPGGGFRRVEVVGVRYVASSPSESARAASERGSFASERARAASGSPVSDGGRKGPQRSPGEVQLRQTSRGFGASGDEVRTEGLESERAGLIPLTNGLTTFQTGAYSPSRQAGFEGVASLQVEVYEDLLRGSEDESEDSPSSRTPSDGLKIDRTLQIETESDLRRFLGTSERSKTDGKDGVVSGEGTSKAGEVPQEQSAATDHELRSRSRSPGGGLLDEVTGSHSRVLVAEGSTAAAAAAAMAARAEVGLPSAVLENSTSEACGSSATGPNVGLQSSRNAGEPGLSERGLGLGSLAEKSSPSDEDLDQHPLVEQTTRASKSNVSSRRFSTDLKVNHDQPLSSKSTLAVPYRQPLEQTLGTVRPAQAPQQSGLIASLGHAAHAFSRPKAYTMYILQTVTRDGRVWTTERRYRDLAALRTQLGRALPGAVLPLPFAHVSAQKRNLFGSTDPEVVDQRKELFETCLSALIELGPPLATAPPLIKFLCGSLEQTGSSLTNNAKPGSGAEEAGEIMSPGLTSGLTSPSTPGSPRSSWGEDAGGASGGGEFGASETGAAVLGSSIRLIVDLPGKRSVSRQLQVRNSAYLLALLGHLQR